MPNPIIDPSQRSGVYYGGGPSRGSLALDDLIDVSTEGSIDYQFLYKKPDGTFGFKSFNFGTIAGSYPDEESLTTAHPSGAGNSSYVVGGDLYIWDSTQWVNVGPFAGTSGGSGGLSSEEIRDLVAGFIVAGSNVTVTHSDVGDTLTIAATGTGGLDTEQVQDVVGAMVQPGSGIAATYNDAGNVLTLSVSSTLTREQVEDLLANSFAAGTGITIAYSDGGDSFTISVDTSVIATKAFATGEVSAHAASGHWTIEDLQDAVAAMVTAGTNQTISYDDTLGTLTFSATASTGGLTQEQAEDIAAAMTAAGTGMTVGYTDNGAGAGTLTLSVDTSVIATRAYAAGLVDDLSGVTDAGAARTALGLGSAATASTAAFDPAGAAAAAEGAATATASSDATTKANAAQAAAVASSLQKASNLSDVASAATARTNLGLGSAAVANVGTASTEVTTNTRVQALVDAAVNSLLNGAPAGFDTLKEISDQLSADESAVSALTSTVAGKLAKASNLSDLTDAAAARTNLGLGDAATKSVGTTAGTVMAGDTPTGLTSEAVMDLVAALLQEGTGVDLQYDDALNTFTISIDQTQTIVSPKITCTGSTGSTEDSSYCGRTLYGPPASGAHVEGDWIISTATSQMWVCTAAGTPGVWRPSHGVYDLREFGAVSGAGDNTAAFTAAIAAIPDGSVLWIDIGDWQTNGGHSITRQLNVIGVAKFVSNIYTNHATNAIFTFNTSRAPVVKHLSISHGGVNAPAAGSAAVVLTGAGGPTSSGGVYARFEDISVYGFYDNIVFLDASWWVIENCVIMGPIRYGLRCVNNNNPDWADASIVNCQFIGIGTAIALIQIEGGGGLRIANNKIQAGASYGINVELRDGVGTSDLQITNNSFEDFIVNAGRTPTGIRIFVPDTSSTHLKNINIHGNQFALATTNATAISLSTTFTTTRRIENVSVVGNTIWSCNVGYNVTGVSTFVAKGNTFAGVATPELHSNCVYYDDDFTGGGSMTREQIEDLLASSFVAGAGISIAYSDASNSFTITNTYIPWGTRVTALTDAATITSDCSTTDIGTVVLAGNRTLGAPSGTAVNGQRIQYRVRQDGTGSRTLAYNAAFRFGADVTSPTLSTTANKTDYLLFEYNSTDAKWDCVSVVKGY